MQHDTTPNEILFALTVIKLVLVGAAAVFLYFALRAYIRYKSPRMLALIGAVTLMTIGAVAEGIALQTDALNLDYAHLAESLFFVVGFLLLLYSLFAPATRVHLETAGLPPESSGESEEEHAMEDRTPPSGPE